MRCAPFVLGIIGALVTAAFWWITMWWLLARRVSWKALLPSAIATALFWIGMEAVFSITFSGSVISDARSMGRPE